MMNTKKEGKICRVCEKFVENDGLSKSGLRKDGSRRYKSVCIDCDRERLNGRRAKYRSQGVTVVEKRCNYCNLVKHRSEFYTNPTVSDGLCYQCRSCTRETQSMYILTPSGEKVRKRDYFIEKYGASCSYCSEDIDEGKLETDHIVAMTKRGVHAIENLTLACKDCNRTKRNHNLATFSEIMGERFRPNKYIRSIMAMEEEELVLRGLKRPLPTTDAVDNYRLMLEAMAAEQTDDDSLFDLLIDAGDCRQ